MKKDPVFFIKHMLEAIELIEKYVGGKTREDFFASSQIQDAVIRRLEIMGEASKSITDEIKGRFPEVPWKKLPA